MIAAWLLSSRSGCDDSSARGDVENTGFANDHVIHQQLTEFERNGIMRVSGAILSADLANSQIMSIARSTPRVVPHEAGSVRGMS
jgi:hypothetical protein